MNNKMITIPYVDAIEYGENTSALFKACLLYTSYNLCLAGNGPTKIARMLTEQQIPTPGTLEYRRTDVYKRQSLQSAYPVHL